MPRVLVVRYEGQPFLIRMSKVIGTILDSGWECDILIPENGLGKTNVSKEMGHDLGERVRIFEFPVPGSRPARFWRSLTAATLLGSREFERRLTTLLAGEHYDLVWVKDTPTLPIVFRALARAGKPHIKVVCDMYENVTQLIYDDLIRFGNWRTRASARVRRLLPRLRAAEKAGLPRCDHIFVVVEEAKSFLVKRYGLDPSRITVVHNVEVLADFDRIEEEPLPIEREGMLITYVGGFGAIRGLDTLIEAVGIVASRPHPPFHLALVGAPEPEIGRLAQLCRQAGIPEGVVTIFGFVPHRAAMRWIKQADLGIIPHVDTLQVRTTIPNKLFQYMASGVGCIVSDVGPLGRITRETECGLLFLAGSPHDLAGRITYAVEHPEEVQSLGAQGRAAAERRYCWEIEGQGYARYLASLL